MPAMTLPPVDTGESVKRPPPFSATPGVALSALPTATLETRVRLLGPKSGLFVIPPPSRKPAVPSPYSLLPTTTVRSIVVCPKVAIPPPARHDRAGMRRDGDAVERDAAVADRDVAVDREAAAARERGRRRVVRNRCRDTVAVDRALIEEQRRVAVDEDPAAEGNP